MADFPFVLGVLDAGGVHIDPLRADGTRAPIMLRLDPSIQGEAEVSGGLTNVTLVVNSDAIDGDRLNIDYTPANYTPTTDPPEVDATNQMTAHLAGIDDLLGGAGGVLVSVFGRTGTVVGVAGDYTASLVTFTPNGDLSATNAQAAIVELRDDTDVKIAAVGGTASNRVVVRALADLPTPSGGDITLAAATEYDFQGVVDIGVNRLLVTSAGTVLRGNHYATNGVTSTNATEVVRSSGVLVEMRDLVITNLGSGGSFYSLSSPGTGPTNIRLCKMTGVMTIDQGAVVLMNSCDIVNGLVMEGACGSLVIIDSLWRTAAVGFDMPSGSSLSGVLSMINCSFIAAPTDICIRVVAATQPARVELSRVGFGASTSPMSGADPGSDNWELRTIIGNVTESQDEGVATFDGTGTPGTVALSTGQVWADVSDGGADISFSLDANAQKFSLSDANTGEMQYNGVANKSFKLGANVSYERVGGQNVRCQIGIAVNGTIIPSTIVNITTANGMNTSAIQLSFAAMTNGDNIRLQVRNVDDTNPGNDISVGFATITSGS